MIKFEGYEIYAVNTNGLWYTLIFKDGKSVYSKNVGYVTRNFAIVKGKLLISLKAV